MSSSLTQSKESVLKLFLNLIKLIIHAKVFNVLLSVYVHIEFRPQVHSLSELIVL